MTNNKVETSEKNKVETEENLETKQISSKENPESNQLNEDSSYLKLFKIFGFALFKLNLFLPIFFVFGNVFTYIQVKDLNKKSSKLFIFSSFAYSLFCLFLAIKRNGEMRV